MAGLLGTTNGAHPYVAQPRQQQAVRPLVVVADDHADERAMTGMMLRFRGFDVILTADGRDALDAVVAHGADAVVSDMDMPNLNGLALCRALRALRVHQTLPIIVYTGGVDDPRVREARLRHGAEAVSKSLAVTQVAALLRQMITVAA